MEEAADQELASRPRLDPKTSESRFSSCTRCHEPVASSAWSGRVVLHCGYCSFQEERELLETPAVEEEARVAGPYRDTHRASPRSEKLALELGALLPGRSVAELDSVMLRASCARRPLLDEDLASVEWERVWMGVWLAYKRALAGQPLEARIALETALLATRTPAYRALLLAHLAQHAASLGATALAKKWLRACPEVAVAEIDSEVRAARAMIALARDKPGEARRKTGDLRAGEGFTGYAIFLAIALNIEAHERLGDWRVVDAILTDLKKKKLLPSVSIPMGAFKLAQRSVLRFAKKVRLRSTLTSALWGGAPVLGVLALRPVGLGPTLLAAALAAATSAGLSWATFGVAPVVAWKKSAWLVTSFALHFACVIVPVLALLGLPAPTTPASPVASPSRAAAAPAFRATPTTDDQIPSGVDEWTQVPPSIAEDASPAEPTP